jgi:hypothetical protein
MMNTTKNQLPILLYGKLGNQKIEIIFGRKNLPSPLTHLQKG